jgi:hypothetical protein
MLFARDLTLIGRDVRFLARRRSANFSNPSVIEELLLLQEQETVDLSLDGR